MIVGYARVSTTDQDLTVQLEALKLAGCERVFCEQVSGGSTDGRDQLQECVAFVREGDLLMVTRLDRFARSMRDLHVLVGELTAKKVGFRCLQQSAVDTTNAQGRLMMSVLGAFAEFELDLNKERQREGIARAKANGVYKGGRPKAVTREMVEVAAAGGKGAAEVAELLGCSRATIYRRAPGLFGDQPAWLQSKEG